MLAVGVAVGGGVVVVAVLCCCVWQTSGKFAISFFRVLVLTFEILALIC